MKDTELLWTVHSRERICHTPVFDVLAQKETAANGMDGTYVAISAPDGVVVIPVYGSDFFMVKQWRHGLEALSVEFPAGLCDPNEDPALAAARELREETGCLAGKITLLCECNPNPALFKNRLFVYLAEDLTPTGRQELDADEFLNAVRLPIREVIRDFGTGLFQHAYTGTAIGMYLRHRLLSSPDPAEIILD